MSFKRSIAVSVIAVAALVGGAAQAHPRLVSTSPRANSGVAGISRVSLTFSERLLAPMSGGDILLTGHPGVAQQPPMKIAGIKPFIGVDGKTLELVSARPLAKGSYQVKWHAVAADTHRVAGVFAFAVK